MLLRGECNQDNENSCLHDIKMKYKKDEIHTVVYCSDRGIGLETRDCKF